jgi:hypothetical protein
MEKKLVLGRDRAGYMVTLELRINKKICRNYETLQNEEMDILSISGYGQYRPHQDHSYGGQIQSDVKSNIHSFNRKSTKDIRRILNIWNEYHLNDLQAGTKKQMECLKDNKEIIERKGGLNHHYEVCCEVLKTAGLFEDNGIKYGHVWLAKPIPPEVITEITELFKEDK